MTIIGVLLCFRALAQEALNDVSLEKISTVSRPVARILVMGGAKHHFLEFLGQNMHEKHVSHSYAWGAKPPCPC
jgi:hypothetical protein